MCLKTDISAFQQMLARHTIAYVPPCHVIRTARLPSSRFGYVRDVFDRADHARQILPARLSSQKSSQRTIYDHRYRATDFASGSLILLVLIVRGFQKHFVLVLRFLSRHTSSDL